MRMLEITDAKTAPEVQNPKRRHVRRYRRLACKERNQLPFCSTKCILRFESYG